MVRTMTADRADRAERAEEADRSAPRDGAGDHRVESTRVSRVWLATGVGLVLLLLAAVFMGQNTDDVELDFLAWSWQVPLGVALLLSAVLGGLVVLLLGIARMVQLRRVARRHREADEQPPGPGEGPPADRREASEPPSPPPPPG